MAADKRSVTTDALDTLGTIIDETAKRDAIHIAVEPAIAGQTLRPGDNVGRRADGTYGGSDEPVGIVDPFLTGNVLKGQRFWLLVYPRKITSLRHVWAHPAFDDVDEPTPSISTKEASEKWLREFVAKSDCPDYDTVIAAASGQYVEGVDGYGKAYELQDWGDGERYLYFAGRDAHSAIPPEFWDHVEIVTGVKIDKGNRAEHFSCSC